MAFGIFTYLQQFSLNFVFNFLGFFFLLTFLPGFQTTGHQMVYCTILSCISHIQYTLTIKNICSEEEVVKAESLQYPMVVI